jgi:hypothetical protein
VQFQSVAEPYSVTTPFSPVVDVKTRMPSAFPGIEEDADRERYRQGSSNIASEHYHTPLLPDSTTASLVKQEMGHRRRFRYSLKQRRPSNISMLPFQLRPSGYFAYRRARTKTRYTALSKRCPCTRSQPLFSSSRPCRTLGVTVANMKLFSSKTLMSMIKVYRDRPLARVRFRSRIRCFTHSRGSARGMSRPGSGLTRYA